MRPYLSVTSRYAATAADALIGVFLFSRSTSQGVRTTARSQPDPGTGTAERASLGALLACGGERFRHSHSPCDGGAGGCPWREREAGRAGGPPMAVAGLLPVPPARLPLPGPRRPAPRPTSPAPAPPTER